MAKSLAPVGFIFTITSIVTGSLWGKPTWGIWWAWDARLTSMLILLFFYLAYILTWKFVNDFKNCNRMIFGGDTEDTSECVKLLSSVFPNKSYFMTDWRTAETVKYFINTLY